MANTKKAIEEVTEKEIPRAAYEGVLTIDVDAQVESAQEQEDTRWHQLLNAHRTRKVLTGQLGGIEKLESGPPYQHGIEGGNGAVCQDPACL